MKNKELIEKLEYVDGKLNIFREKAHNAEKEKESVTIEF